MLSQTCQIKRLNCAYDTKLVPPAYRAAYTSMSTLNPYSFKARVMNRVTPEV